VREIAIELQDREEEEEVVDQRHERGQRQRKGRIQRLDIAAQ